MCCKGLKDNDCRKLLPKYKNNKKTKGEMKIKFLCFGLSLGHNSTNSVVIIDIMTSGACGLVKNINNNGIIDSDFTKRLFEKRRRMLSMISGVKRISLEKFVAYSKKKGLKTKNMVAIIPALAE